MVGVLWHHESAARGYYTRAPRSAQNLIHRARENTHMHDFSCSGAESVVSLSYFSPAQPAGPTITFPLGPRRCTSAARTSEDSLEIGVYLVILRLSSLYEYE